MTITKLDHISLLAPEPEPVVDFYCSMLGFSVARRRSIPDMEMNIIDLQRHDAAIEIIQSTKADASDDKGIKHIAFRSDDIEADFDIFKSSGATLCTPAIVRFEQVSFFFVQGPTKELIEIIHIDE